MSQLILVVDDEPRVARLARDYLEKNGFRVLTAGDGQSALTIARRLGLNPVIVEKAESIVRPDTLQADALLEDIKRAKMEALTAAERARERERQAKLPETDLRSQPAWPEPR